MKELEDYTWFPAKFRNFQTEFIGFVVSKFNVYQAFIQYLKTYVPPVKSITDLCSGSGEPAITIFRKSNCFQQLVLTDKYPNALPWKDEAIVYETKSTNVLGMTFKPETCYTMFNAFHHFEDDDKKKIVNKINVAGAPAFFVEILEPRLDCLLKVIVVTTLGTVLFAPFVKPFSIRRLVFTYLIPINIFTITYDGVVSVFKSRSVKQYQTLFEGNDAIKVIRLTNGWAPLLMIQLSSNK